MQTPSMERIRFEAVTNALLRVAEAATKLDAKLHPSMAKRPEVVELRAALQELDGCKVLYEAEAGFIPRAQPLRVAMDFGNREAAKRGS